MTRSMAYEVVDIEGQQVFLALHTKTAPSEDEWNGWTSLLETHARNVGWDLARAANFVVTDGGAPSTSQRTAVNVLIAQGKTMPAVALVTDSAMVRTLARAFSIFNPRFGVFAPARIREAAAYVGVGSPDVPALVTACLRLERDVLGAGAVATLAALRRGGPW